MLEALQEQLGDTVQEALDAFAAAPSEEALLQAKGAWLGKQGKLTLLLRSMRDLEPDQRPAFGQAVNRAKERVEEALDARRIALRDAAKLQKLARERVDLTLPAPRPTRGAIHPLRRVERDLIRIFQELGYDVARGPEVESDFHNFEALNFPPDHPARDMQDTFLVEGPGSLLLRTHTSSVQIRTMLANEPPIQIIAPGAVYRSDEVDMTHHPMFHQLEALFIDREVTMAHLKGTLEAFVARLFGREVPIRLRPSFFPFTEPSAEVDVECVFCGGDGCRVCSHSGWIEILGSGMVHPAVLEACGIDPDQWQGFALGMGIERIAMLKYGVSDIRLFFENDQRFLAQFP